jgi:flagellar motor switch protein FliN/FliY
MTDTSAAMITTEDDGPAALDPGAVATTVPPGAGAPTAGPGPEHDEAPSTRSLDLLHGVEMTVTVELGRTKMLLRDLLALQTGSVIELDRAAGSPVDVLINDNLLARGEVVVLDDEFGVRILDIVMADGQPARH